MRKARKHKKKAARIVQSIQRKCLRVIAGAYGATSTEALEIEMNIASLDLHLYTPYETKRNISTEPNSGLTKHESIRKQQEVGKKKRRRYKDIPTS